MTQDFEIEISAITEHVVNCPWCSAELVSVTPEQHRTLQGCAYLTDGDMIEVSGRAAPGTQCSLEPELLVGQCRGCQRHYYVVEIHVMKADQDTVFEYFAGYRDPSAATHVLGHAGSAGDLPASWLITLLQTPDGALQVHEFGPFRVEDLSTVKGAHGVSPCEGRGRTTPWTSSAALVERLRPQLFALSMVQALGVAGQEGSGS